MKQHPFDYDVRRREYPEIPVCAAVRKCGETVFYQSDTALPFPLGRLSRLFSGLCVTKLLSAGILTCGDLVCDRLPAYPEKHITVGDILVSSDRETLLPALCEAAVGMPYPAMIKEELLLPFGLSHTVCAPCTDVIPPFSSDTETFADPMTKISDGKSGIYSDCHDLLLFTDMLLTSLKAAAPFRRSEAEFFLSSGVFLHREDNGADTFFPDVCSSASVGCIDGGGSFLFFDPHDEITCIYLTPHRLCYEPELPKKICSALRNMR